MRRGALMVLLVSVVLAACDGGGDSPETTQESVASPTSAPVATLPPPEPTIVVPTATVSLGLAPDAPPAATVGMPVRVVVHIAGVTNLAAYQFTPVFDPAFLELVKVTDAGFAGSTGRVPTCSLSRTEGTTTFFCVSGGASPAGPSGDGELAVLEFRVVALGGTEVSLERAAATMPDATDIPLTIVPATILSMN